MTAAEAERLAALDLNSMGVMVDGIAAPIDGIDEFGPTAELILSTWSETDGQVQPRRVFRVRHEISTPFRARFRSYVDAVSGEILGRTNEIVYAAAEGTVQGDQQPLTPTDPYVRSPFEDLGVNVTGIGTTYTDDAGHFALDFPDGIGAPRPPGWTARYCDVNCQDAPDAQRSPAPHNRGRHLLVFQDGNSAPAERDLFFHTKPRARLHSGDRSSLHRRRLRDARGGQHRAHVQRLLGRIRNQLLSGGGARTPVKSPT
jgi:hypothetical protein